jgi:flagellar M-ring protein FliF
VVILDSFGRPLARPEGDEDDPLGAARTERQQRLEREMSARVVALLEPVVGEDRVRVNVALKLNPSTREETEERFDPNSVVRSRQNSSDVAQSAAAAMMVAGARGNAVPQPTADGQTKSAAVAGPNGQTSSRSAETTNYEISRLTRHTIQPPGDVARVSVAVILDDEPVVTKGKDGQTKMTRQPRKREDLQKIQGLVAAAVGLETDRGDQLTVENVSFEEAPIEEVPTPTLLEKYSPQLWEGGRILGVLLVGVFGLMLFMRPLMRKAGVEPVEFRPAAALAVATAIPANGSSIKTVAELESEIESQLDASTAPTAEQRRLPVLTKRVAALSAQQPESVAKLLRHWISESER